MININGRYTGVYCKIFKFSVNFYDKILGNFKNVLQLEYNIIQVSGVHIVIQYLYILQGIHHTKSNKTL